MAAAVSSVWAKPGTWALDAEEEDKQSHPSDSSDFPSLAAAATTKTKKKKGQTISLAEFATYGSAKAAAAAPPLQTERLTQAELVSLPTGPRERSADELDRSKLGGGFRGYGSGSRDSSSSRWGSSRASEDGERRGGGFNNRERESGPSRADETDNWAAAKKPAGFERRERSGGFFENQSQSKADEVDSWVSTKPSEPRRFEKRGSFESLSRNRDSQYGGGGSSDSESWGRRREENGGSRPKLMLQPRTLPVANVDVKPEIAIEKPNPFGKARPREEVLAEKGQDWKEIDEKLEAVKFKEAMDKADEKSLGNNTERSWRKSTEEEAEATTTTTSGKEEEATTKD